MTARRLTVAYRSLPPISDLDFAVVRTLDVHEILILLGGAPFFSSGDHVEPIYAEDFESSDDFRIWFVHFRKDAKFSDGSKLSASHWYHSVARAIRVGAGVHFNPKKDLVGADSSRDGYCEGLSLTGDVVRLQLKEPNRNFPRLLGKVEATVLPIESAATPILSLLNAPSSGPYVLRSYSENEARFEINKNFPGHKNRAAYAEIVVRKLNDGEACQSRIKGEVDYIFPMSVPAEPVKKILERTSQVYRDFAHTIFLSFRTHPNSDESSRPWSNILAHRQSLATLLKQMPSVESYEKCSTLLLGDGLGRLKSGPIFESAVSVQSLPKFKLAAVERPHTHAIVEYLSSHGVNISVTWVKTFNELFSGKALETDGFIGWNDFCADDPYISLYNALNPQRPLFLDNGNLRQELTAIQMETEVSAKDRRYQALHRKILDDCAAIPILAQWFDAYASKDLNISTMKGGVIWTLGPSK